jgi:nucleoside-diphosphate-sugar epimerase
MDLTDGTGLQDAVTDVDIIVHAASDAQGDPEPVDVDGTNRLLSAARGAGIENFVYVSLVGVDAITYSYYEHKQAADRAVEESPMPSA